MLETLTNERMYFLIIDTHGFDKGLLIGRLLNEIKFQSPLERSLCLTKLMNYCVENYRIEDAVTFLKSSVDNHVFERCVGDNTVRILKNMLVRGVGDKYLLKLRSSHNFNIFLIHIDLLYKQMNTDYADLFVRAGALDFEEDENGDRVYDFYWMKKNDEKTYKKFMLKTPFYKMITHKKHSNLREIPVELMRLLKTALY